MPQRISLNDRVKIVASPTSLLGEVGTVKGVNFNSFERRWLSLMMDRGGWLTVRESDVELIK